MILGIDGPEFLVIILVFLVVVGPKEMPKMIRSLSRTIGHMQTIARQFRQQLNEAMAETDLASHVNSVEKTTSMDKIAEKSLDNGSLSDKSASHRDQNNMKDKEQGYKHEA